MLLNRPLDDANSHPTVVECPGKQQGCDEEHSNVGQENAGVVLKEFPSRLLESFLWSTEGSYQSVTIGCPCDNNPDSQKNDAERQVDAASVSSKVHSNRRHFAAMGTSSQGIR